MPILGQPPGGRAAHRAAVTERIEKATTALLADGAGFGDLSIEQITKAAGISRTAFYDYFADKRELLVSLVEAHIEFVFADTRPGDTPLSGPDALRLQIAGSMRFAREHHEIFRAAVEASAYDERIAGFWMGGVMERFFRGAEVMAVRDLENGAALPVHAAAYARAVVLMTMQMLYNHVSRDDGLTDDEVVETLVTICVRALYGEA